MQIGETIVNAELGEILEELKSQLTLNGFDLLRDIKDSGDNIMVTCPYHKNGQERKPSAGLLKVDGTFHCFTCGETHTLAEMISFCFGRDDFGLFGKQWLIKNFATLEVEMRKPLELNLSRISSGDDLKPTYVSEEELDSYRYYHPYMYKRKLNDEVIERFDIGYDKNTQCITFPIRDVNGNTLFIARRSVNTKYFNYPSGAEKPLYGIYELLQLDRYPNEVIVCESMLDALACWVWGRPAVALNGLGDSLQYEQLNRLPCRKLILATDNDKAGLDARKKLRRNIKGKIIVEFDEYPGGKKDINDLTEDEFRGLKEVFNGIH